MCIISYPVSDPSLPPELLKYITYNPQTFSHSYLFNQH